MKNIWIILSIFSFVHVVRDILQMRGVKNWFTTVGHFWKKPEYEIHSIVFFTVLGVIFLLIFLW